MTEMPKRLVEHGLALRDLECELVARAESEALAAELARRWNAHEGLVAACKGLMQRMVSNELLGKCDSLGRLDQAAYEAARSALAEVEEEKGNYPVTGEDGMGDGARRPGANRTTPPAVPRSERGAVR